MDNRWTIRLPEYPRPSKYNRLRQQTTKIAKDLGIPLGQYVAEALIRQNKARLTTQM